ncbi:MAG TPA: hypothetical protein VFX60_18060 [Micromonospora sp.]|nr:hypothetical protein [Micromonospora sp.]
MAIAGFNFARFQLTSARRRVRVRAAWRGIVLPAMLWISLALVFTRDYSVPW